ncbi:MAG: VIT1/CCC1 transporter family protein [Porticoccaceae bacterium]|jgi:VIT1/CCC1 family predicted Fe2+/Mn2+ transporter
MTDITRKRSREFYRATHSPGQIAARLDSGPGGIYLKDFIYGAVDGAVTTFAIVAGVAGAGLSASVIIILGIANLVADGFSMAVGNYLGTRAENELRDKARQRELDEIDKYPAGEREEIRQIYARKGFDGELLEQVVEVITSERERWADVMLQEEYGMALNDHNAIRGGLATFAAFCVVGLIPLLPYLYNWLWGGQVVRPFLWSAALTAIAFAVVGAIKARVIDQRWHTASAETLLIGGGAAALAYGAGVLLKGLAG